MKSNPRNEIDLCFVFFFEAVARAVFEILFFVFSRWWRTALVALFALTYGFTSWAEMKVRHDHDEYFFAWCESVERHLTQPER